MDKVTDIKEVVRNKYSQIARDSEVNSKGCGCGCGCDDSDHNEYSIITDEYKNLDGYLKDADLNLGCGVPTELAGINAGDTVVDLGSGAGNDVFVTRALTGESGKVIGIDFSKDMLSKAERNNEKLGYKNVEFKFGEIEEIPLPDGIADVVISNCVLNLVPDKNKAFSEVFRILKPGGHFCISDIVLRGELPEQLKESAAAYAGCVSGAMQQKDYLKVITDAGFDKVEIKASRVIVLPDELVKEYLPGQPIDNINSGDLGVVSITVVGYKN
jgi:SAM-dependent methyltransferase